MGSPFLLMTVVLLGISTTITFAQYSYPKPTTFQGYSYPKPTRPPPPPPPPPARYLPPPPAPTTTQRPYVTERVISPYYAEPEYVHSGSPYDFTYSVKDPEYGNDFAQNEVNDGEVTRGEYRVLMPDGRTQIVKYTADWKNGFNAQVTYAK